MNTLRSVSILLFSIVLLVSVASATNAQMQRLVVPIQTIVVGGGSGPGNGGDGTSGGSTSFNAYCTDVYRGYPRGSMSPLPGAGSVSVARSDGTVLSIAEAIASGWIEFSGVGSANLADVVSLTGDEYEIAVRSPFVLSPHPDDDLVDDLLETVDWVANLGANPSLNASRVWEHRDQVASATLGDDAQHSHVFGSDLARMHEARQRVIAAGGNLIYYWHEQNQTTGEFDRFMLSPDGDVSVFSGPAADAELLASLAPIDGELRVARPPYAPQYEQAAHIEQGLKVIEEELLRQLNTGAISRDQFGAELTRQRRLAENATEGAIEFSLTLASSSALTGRAAVVLLDYDRSRIFTGDGAILVAAEVVASGGGGSGGEPPDLTALLPVPSDGEHHGSAAVHGQGSWWQIRVTSPIKRRTEELTSAAYGRLRMALNLGLNETEIVDQVSLAADMNAQAYEAFDLPPEERQAQLRLFRDERELLNLTVVEVVTENGTSYALTTIIETP